MTPYQQLIAWAQAGLLNSATRRAQALAWFHQANTVADQRAEIRHASRQFRSGGLTPQQARAAARGALGLRAARSRIRVYDGPLVY